MAQKIQIVLEDDLDGSEASQTVTFGLDGTTYEIDLNDAHADELREALAGYIGHARKVSGSAGRRGGRKAAAASSAGGPSASDIRAWATENGYEVPDRGRISADVRAAYDAAH
ncbi:Lsr2 family protein [Nocardioides fonticola]|uniref:Lsr2 family protein n=1 Tax=Nocardioides fonticola TaxID=450363 RepID=A0ABP7XEG8_9ACTN